MADEIWRFEVLTGELLPKTGEIRKPPRKAIGPDPGGAILIVDSVTPPPGVNKQKDCPCDVYSEMLHDGSVILTVYADPKTRPVIHTIHHLETDWEVRVPALDLSITIKAAQ